jgi:hypothetical protein
MSFSTSSSPSRSPTRIYLGMLVLDLRDDRADRLVDERNPDVLRPRHL